MIRVQTKHQSSSAATLNTQLVNIVLDYRLKQGLTQAQIAAKLDISRVTWNFIENGRKPLPFALLKAIESQLGIEFHYKLTASFSYTRSKEPADASAVRSL